jgi:mRNA-degrading endonuclease RelE of RelBE toxin-antitoxin system
MYKIEYAEDVSEDLINLRGYDRKQILRSIEKQLRYEPTKETRNRKPLIGLIPPWDHLEPVWELRVGDYRVFYDVDDEAAIVKIRAI